MNINREFISKENTYGDKNQPKYIVIHETDNFSTGADAQRHAQAQAAGHLSTSVQYYSGSDGVYQAAEHADGTFSVGKEYGGNHSVTDATNRNTINIEICVNPDGDYNVARANAIELVKYIIQQTGIPTERVIRHYDAKGKYCPRKMMDNPGLWEDFKAQLKDQAAHPIQPTPPTEVQPSISVAIGTVVTQKDPLLIRSQPNTESEPLGSIPKGATVKVLEQGTDWHRVQYQDRIGYSAAKYIKIVNMQTNGGYVGKCTGNEVRVRSTPNFGDNTIRYLNKGNLFDVLSANGVWTHISVEGKEGYIYSEYVAKA